MMKKKIAIVGIVALLLTAAISTFAYLTAKTGEVKNTFTVGAISIDLTETYEQGSKIYPGAIITKIPVVTVKANSEPAYVYVSVDNQLGAAGVLDIDPVNWIKVGTDGATKSVYRYKEIVELNTSDTLLTVFTKVTIPGELTSVTGLEEDFIILSAYAHQSLSTTEAVADAAALAQLLPTP